MNDFMGLIGSGCGRAAVMVWLGGNEVRAK